MREEERIVHVDRVEEIAKLCGLKCRRDQIRSLTVIKVFDEVSKEWILFDPVFQGKDIARMLFHLCKRWDGYDKSEVEFRSNMLDWILEQFKEDDKTISKER